MGLKRKLLPAVLAGSILGSAAFAGGATGTVVNHTVVSYAPVLIFWLDDGTPEFAPCATTHRFALNLATPQGQAQAAMVMTAKAQGRPLEVIGTGTCTLHDGVEDVQVVSAS